MRKGQKNKAARDKKTRPTSRQAGHPVAGLVGPVLEFDLPAETERLGQEEVWRTTSRNAKTLVKYSDFRVVLIRMKGGTRMEGHKAAGSLSAQTLTGDVLFHLPGRTVDLPVGHLLTLERALPHSVEAREESSFLLSLSWPKGG